jgi:hypothetical protein
VARGERIVLRAALVVLLGVAGLACDAEWANGDPDDDFSSDDDDSSVIGSPHWRGNLDDDSSSSDTQVTDED